MEKLDDKIKTLEQLGCFDKPSARYKDIRESISAYKETREESQSIGYSR